MASINKRSSFSMLRRLGAVMRRRFVAARLYLSRLAGVGRASALHDIKGLPVIAVTALHMIFGKAAAVLKGIFNLLVERLFVYTEPAAELAAKVMAEVRLAAVRLGSRRSRRGRLIPVMMLATATLCICTMSFLTVDIKVEINGVPVGFVSSRGEMEEILSQIEDKVSEYTGYPYTLDLDVTYSMAYSGGVRGIDREYISNYVMSNLDNVSTKYVMLVNGQPIGANKSRTALELLKQRMLELNTYQYRGGRLEFVQDVQIVPQGSIEAPELTVEEIQAKMSGNVKEAVTYIVQSGDTVSGIAKKYSVSVNDIINMNPGLEPHKIRTGDSLTISASVPMLGVKETVTENYVQRIAYETEKTTTDRLYTTQQRVVKSGVFGEANVTADVVYINGVEDSRVVMNWQVTKEPQSEVIEVGTKKPPAKAPTGSFRKPSNGVFSSGYGYRKNLGDFHTGVDFAGAVGTAIYAADGGKVTFAGWKGNYGNCIFIDHGNGYVTVYAHCSKLLVKSGQSVAKGENIARVGATGRVTGPHLHFEIRVNGKHTNPLNYISK